jgi:hypothetical protein
MNFLGLFKKKSVPEELPDLAIDEIKEKVEEKEKRTEKQSSHNKNSGKNYKNENDKSDEKEKIDVEKNENISKESKRFFDKLVQDINQEIDDLEKFENWIGDYWESRKKDFIVKNLGGNFKEKLSNKVEKLEKLEREWQDKYFELIEKEEEMKDMEKDLKKLFSKFGKLCKRRGDIKKNNS